jgi:ribonuclease T1
MRWSLVLAVLVAVLASGCALVGGGHDGSTPRTDGTPARATVTAAAELPAGWHGGTVDVAELPGEAIDTLLLIGEGGPFPYDQDGATFQNREGILPDHPRGYYREYTVGTPGSPDRGARRIVVGRDGERYYTDDHYDSFRLIVGTAGS